MGGLVKFREGGYMASTPYAQQQETTDKKSGLVYTPSPDNIKIINRNSQQVTQPAQTIDRRQSVSDRYAKENQASETGKPSDYIRELNTLDVQLDVLGERIGEAQAGATQQDGKLLFQDEASLNSYQSMLDQYEQLQQKRTETAEGYREILWPTLPTNQRAEIIADAIENGSDETGLMPSSMTKPVEIPKPVQALQDALAQTWTRPERSPLDMTPEPTAQNIEKILVQQEGVKLAQQMQGAQQEKAEAESALGDYQMDLEVANNELQAALQAQMQANMEATAWPNDVNAQKRYQDATANVEAARANVQAVEARYNRVTEADAALDALKGEQYFNRAQVDLLSLEPELAERVQKVPEWKQQKTLNSGYTSDEFAGEAGVRIHQELADQAERSIQNTTERLREAGYTDEQIERLYDVAQRQFNQERTEEVTTLLRQGAGDNPVAGAVLTLASVPMSLASGLGYIGTAIDNLKNELGDNYVPIDYYSPEMQGFHYSDAIRSGAAEAIENSRAGSVGSFLYQTGTSMLDSAAVAAITAGTGLPASVLLGGSAATSSMMDAKARGATDGQAVAMGLLSGIAEGFFEKYSVERLLSISDSKRLRNVFKNAVQQSFTEASEETATSIANMLTDAVIMGDKSTYNTAKQEYIAQGYSEEEAAKKAALDMLEEVGMSALGGAISGGLMGGGYSLRQYAGAPMRTVRATEQILRDAGITNADEFYDRIDVTDPELAASTKAGREYIKDAAAAYVQQNQETAAPMQQETAGTEQQTNVPAQEAPDTETVAEQQQTEDDRGPWWDREEPESVAQNETARYTETNQPAAQIEDISPRWPGNERMENDGGTEVSGRTAGRQQLERTGEQTAGRVRDDAGRIGPATEQSRAAAIRQTQGKVLQLQKVSSKSLGLQNGTDTASVQVMPESSWDSQLQETARWVREETGKEISFVLGTIEVGTKKGMERVRGVYLPDRIIVQADNARLTPEQIARHEEWHDITHQTPWLTREVREKIEDTYGKEEFDEILQQYVKRMRKLLNLDDNASDEQIDQALRMAEEEIFADAYAGINAFGAEASRYQEDVQPYAQRELDKRQQQREQQAQRETGPPAETEQSREAEERYSAEEEDEEIDLKEVYAKQEAEFQNKAANIRKRLETLESSEYQEQQMERGGTAALQANERQIRQLRKELAKMEGTATVTDQRSGTAQSVNVQPTLAKADFRNNMMNLFSIPQSQRGTISAILDNFADRVTRYGRIDDRDRDALFDRLYDEGVMEVAADAYYQDARSAIAGGRIYVPRYVKEEFGDDWASFRKQAFANRVYLTDDQNAAGIDSWNAELSEILPGLFDANELDAKTALERIVQVAEEGRSENMSLAEYTQQIAGETGMDVDTILQDIERQMDYQIRAFAEKAQLETELRTRPALLRAETNSIVKSVRAQRDQAIEAVKAHYNELLAKRSAEMAEAVGEARETAKRRVERVRKSRDQKIEAVLAHYQEQLDRKVQRVRESAQKRMDAQEAHYAEMTARERARIEARDAKERARRKEMQERRTARRELRDLQQKTLRQLQWLNKNRFKAPEDLKAAFDEVLGDIDVYAVSAADEMNWSGKYQATWKDLADMYKRAKETDPNFLPSQDLERIVSRLDNDKIADLDIDALQNLYRAAVGLRTEFRNRNTLIGDEKQRIFEEVYEDVSGELREASHRKTGTKADKFFNSGQLSPMNYLQRMAGWNPNSTFYGTMAKQLEQGERAVRKYKVDANLRLQNFLQENADWVARADGQGKDGIWYELQVSPVTELRMGAEPIFGEPVTIYMTPAQKVHMYLESKNDENLRHMLGGRTFVNKELYEKGKRQEALAQGKTIRLAPQEVKRIVSDLTTEEMELATILEAYYNQYAKEEINRVSNILYGYDKAIGRNYAPIYTNQNYTQKEIGTYDATAEGVGPLKSRVVSKNPSYNLSAFDAFERHVDQTAKFVGLSVPIRNWNTLLNWRTSNNSMGDVITHTWGKESQDFITDTIKRLQSAEFAPKDAVQELADKVTSNYVRAIFGANLGTALKQPLGLFVAAADLEYRYAPTPAQVHRVDSNLVNTYTPEIAYRGMGYATMETRQLKENPGWTERNKFVKTVFGGGALTAMDQKVVKTMWAWAENKVKRENPDIEIGSEQDVQSGNSPYYKKVAEVFEHALYATQPMADEMHVSGLRKSRNPITRAVTMFRSDAMVMYNLLRQKAGEIQYYERQGKTEKVRSAKRALGAVILAALGSAAGNELVDFAMAMWKNKGKLYRNEDGDLTVESIAEEAITGLLTSLAGNATAAGDELAEFIASSVRGRQWYGIETPGITQLTDIAEAVEGIAKASMKLTGDVVDVVASGGSLPEYLKKNGGAIAGELKDFGETLAMYVGGIPVSNVEAYTLGGVSWILPEAKAELDSLMESLGKSGLKGLEGDVLEVKVRNLMETRLGGDQAPAAEEIARLYEDGETDAIFGDTPEDFSAGQKQIYDMAYREALGDSIETLMQSDTYLNAEDSQKADMLKALYDYADKTAQEAVTGESELSEEGQRLREALDGELDLADWAAYKGIAATKIEGEDGEEKTINKYAALRDTELDDETKVSILGVLMGMEMETSSGDQSEYAKMLSLVGTTMTVDEYLTAKELDAVDRVAKVMQSGTDAESAFDVVNIIEQVKDEMPKASDAEREAAVYEAADTDQDMIAAQMLMDDSAFEKVQAAAAFGVTPESYADFKQRFKNLYLEGSVNQENAEDVISEMMGLSEAERAVLWQMQDKSWKWTRNPFDRSTARDFIEMAGWDE